MKVRVRYAPSPTGFQHIGGVRTALFNYLFARAKGGEFVLRIEDTDRERYQQEAMEDIYNTFDWLGFHWDEGPDIGGPLGPYVQSERVALYREHAQRLVESGHAYPCYCSHERLEELKAEQRRKNAPLGYDRRCRELSPSRRQESERQGITPVIRFKVPLEGSTTAADQLLGSIETGNTEINPDPVLLKSDGFPTYHLANVVDDHLMEITHIMRAQEWLPSMPLHVLLYAAFGWQPPHYCHLPMVLGADGQKLSKRHGATRVFEFKEKGYLPEAVLNYIALLGWSFDDSREFFTLKELQELFSLDRLNKSPAVFDYKKLDWFNGMYIRKAATRNLAERLLPFLQARGWISERPSAGELERVEALIPLIQERLTVLSDVVPLVAFLFEEVSAPPAEELIPKRLDPKRTVLVLRTVCSLLADFEKHSDEENEQRFRQTAEDLGVKLGDLLMPVRVALTGSRVSPPLFESIRVLGMAETLARLESALGTLEDG
ncbi:MAG: glutamate--tRNA ligase [Spirochaetaceae bacterium]|nr:MAG: glutamate--tRNA ligase [Spirochaetaceae bacterium]